MKTGDFKRNVSLIAGKVEEKIKQGTKDVIKACNAGVAPVIAEPNKPTQNATEKGKTTFNFKMNKYLMEANQ